MYRLTIQTTWDGKPIAADEVTVVDLQRTTAAVHLRIDGPLHLDPAPATPPGRVDGLWNFEVVELFLVGPGGDYLEIEIGPWGHYLVLKLEAQRVLTTSEIPLDLSTERGSERWTGTAEIPVHWLPSEIARANAFAIHGEGSARRYLAASPVPGPHPDFHRTDLYPALSRWELTSAAPQVDDLNQPPTSSPRAQAKQWQTGVDCKEMMSPRVATSSRVNLFRSAQ